MVIESERDAGGIGPKQQCTGKITQIDLSSEQGNHPAKGNQPFIKSLDRQQARQTQRAQKRTLITPWRPKAAAQATAAVVMAHMRQNDCSEQRVAQARVFPSGDPQRPSQRNDRRLTPCLR